MEPEKKKKSLELKVFVLAPEDIDLSKLVTKLNKTSADKFIENNPGYKYVRLFADKL